MPVYRHCNDCSWDHDRTEMTVCDGCGSYTCHDCCRCEDYCSDCCTCGAYDDGTGGGGVHSYDYRPRRFQFKGDQSQPMLGVELEVGGSRRSITRAVRNTDSAEEHLYMKSDSSIDGVEIVTHPMTLAWARTYPFDRLLRDLRDEDCYVDEGYGLHIHVGRDAFARPRGPRTNDASGRKYQSSMHQMMWLLLIHRNPEPLTELARRDPEEWGAFHTPHQGELKQKAQRPGVGDRYRAVNCQNDETFELRFFQSTLEPREFMAALEFADASVRYTRDLDAKKVLTGRALSWPHFTNWCARHNYKALHAAIAR